MDFRKVIRSRAPYNGYVQIADVPYSVWLLYGAGLRIKTMLQSSHMDKGLVIFPMSGNNTFEISDFAEPCFSSSFTAFFF